MHPSAELQALEAAGATPPAASPARPSRSGDGQLAQELRDLLAARSGERHIVAVQDFPDPDAISSGLAYREMAAAFDIDVDIVYEGMISHPENLALVNLLEVELTQFHEGLALDRYDAAVFVDNQGTTTRLTGRLREAGVPTFAIVDHHDPQDVLDPVFSDVRAVGAAATQFSQYLESGLFFQMDASNQRHVNLATALMHGLYSETGGFLRAGSQEFRAAAFLSRYADQAMFERVLCVQKSRGTMDTIQLALARRIIRGGLSLAGVGYIRWADRDAIPQAADFLLTEENVHTAVVYGIISGGDGHEVISGSLRTTNATLGVDSFLKQALGKDIRGKAYGGGRSRAGGFEIDIGFLADGEHDPEERDLKWSLFDHQVRRKLFYAAGLEHDKGADLPT